jgi:serine protease Do
MTHLIDNIGEELDTIAARLRGVTVSVERASTRGGSRRSRRDGHEGQGAGIIWSPDGTIVTNAHVVTGESATIRLADGRTTTARVAVRDERRDLALLLADLTDIHDTLPAATIGEPSQLRPGDVVLALGHPLGVEHALALGVVHAAPNADHSPYVVADIKLAPGNSGGPLTDARGRIVGVNSMIVGGLGVAISVDAVRHMLAAAAPRPVLGAQLRPVRVRVPVGSPESSSALLVLGVDPRGAAARAGIIQGDLLFGHAGSPFTSPFDLERVLRDAGPGAILRLDVGRGGKRMVCDVTLGAALDVGRRAA